MQVVVDGSEESALACFWVTDGIDRCRVGFLPRHYFKHWQDFEGRLAQVVELYKDSDSKEKRKKHYRNSGCCQAVLIDTEFGDDADDDIFSPVKWRKLSKAAADGAASKVAVKPAVKEEEKARKETGTVPNDDDVSDDNDDDDDDDDDEDEDEEEELMEDFFKQFPPGTYKVIIGNNNISVSKEETVETEKKESE